MSNIKKIGVIGAGSFGTALALTLVNKGHQVRIWSRDSQQLDLMKETRENPKFLPGVVLPEALEMAYRSMQGGARGLDMGRNIFQSEHPVEMAKAIRMIVHHKATDKEAYEFYLDATHGG